MTEPTTTRFERRGLLGEGGMGRVWRALDQTSGREVALKLAGDGEGDAAALRAEFWWLKRLEGPHLVTALDFGLDAEARPWYAMELLEHGAADALPLAPDQVTTLACHIARALHRLHAAGFVHGDVSLRNVRQGGDGAWRLLDLGLLVPVGQRVTVRGTPDYMAPEVLQGAPADGRADLYAFGAVLYHLLTGRPPFQASSTAALLRAHQAAPPPRPSAVRPGLPAVWDTLVPRLMAKLPGARPVSAAEVLDALGEEAEPGPAGLLSAPLVGREGELAWFDEQLTGLTASRSGAAWRLVGQAGLGKSRLLDVFAVRAKLADARVLRAGCRAGGGPYHPFIAVLRQAWGGLEADAPELLEAHAAGLALLVPDLVRGDERHALEPRAAQLRAQTALTELLVAFGQRCGLVLLLDDWHLADPPSREALVALLRHLPAEPLLVVLGLDAAAPEAAAPGGQARVLAPLDGREVAALASAVFGGVPAPARFVAQLTELTGGVPRHLEVALTHWAASGVIRQEAGRWSLEVLAPEVLARSPGTLLGARLGGLGAQALGVLACLAVAQAPVPLATFLALTAGWDDAARFGALAELEEARLVGRGEGALVVVQRHVVEAWLAGLADVEVKRAHARWVEALVALHPQVREVARGKALRPESTPVAGGARQGDVLVGLARHLGALADEAAAQELVPVAIAAGRHLAGLHDLAAAAAVAEQALRRAGEAEAEASWPLVDGAVWRCAAAVLLGDVRRLQGDLEAAASRYEEALAGAPAPGAAGLRVHGRIGAGVVAQAQGQHEQALAHLRGALPEARRLGEPREELRCLAAMGRSHYQLGERARAALLYEEALGRAEAADDPVYRGECLAFLGYLDVSAEPSEAGPPPTGRGVERLREAVALQGRVGDPLSLNDSYMLLGNALYHLGDMRGAEHAFLRNLALCRELGFFEEAVASLNLALVALARGAPGAAFEQAQAAQGLARDRGDGFLEDLGLALEARAWVALGSPGRARALAQGALGRRLASEDAYGQLLVGLACVEAALELGLTDEAEHTTLELLEAQARSGITEFSLDLAWCTGRLAVRRGERVGARARFEEALGRATQRGAAWWEAQLSLAVGELLVEAEEASEARVWLTRAEDLALGCDARGVLLQGLFHRARLERLDGRGVEADALLQRALELASEAGARPWLARIAHERAMAQFPSPRAGRWLREAQAWLTPLVDELDASARAAFLALEDWQVILAGRPAPLSPRGQEPDVPPPPEEGGTVAALQAELERQRRWFAELQRVAERLQTQLDFSQALQGLEGEEAIIQAALALLLELVGASRADFLAFEGLRLVARASCAAPDRGPVDEDWSFHADLVVAAAHSGEVRYDPDHEDPAVGRRAVLALPLGDVRERWGVVLALGHPSAVPALEPTDLDALRGLAGALLAALRRGRLEAEWQAKTHRLEMLYQLSSKVTSTLVMEEVLDLVLQFSLEVTQAERACIFLADEAGALHSEAAATRDDGGAVTLTSETVSQSILRRVQDTGEPLWVEDTQDDVELRHQKSIQDLNLRSVLAVPLAIHQRVNGVLYVDSRVVVNAFTARDLDVLRAIASHASVALENARLYELATVDRLTRLFFRSHFERRLREELRRLERAGGSVALLMMDIDHFKRFNDAYGHAVGDQVLAHVAGIIRANVREDVDVPCRYGGEEMVVLLPDTDARGAGVFAERVRRAIDETPLSSDVHGPLHVTISIGTAVAPEDAVEGLLLLELADRALYASKRGGRNRVTAWVAGLGT
ncbi:MAG: diguanylate cyclase [Candidatus Sericytochromatia bacterium]|nr:diguanylate cyclase [Candidatus Sericytochromatia bacterium]